MTLTATAPLYVYGVTDADSAPEVRGVGDAEVELIERDGVRALVSELTDGDTVRHLGRAELAAHAAVLEQAQRHGTVLPMRFGVVMEDAQAVTDGLLHAHHDDLVTQLQQLAGKVELRVRAVYEEQALMRDVVNQHPEIARLRDELRDRPLEATPYERIRLGELIAVAVEATRAHDADGLLAALGPIAEGTEVGQPAHERVALDASFLVGEDDVPEFDRAVDQLGGESRGRLRFKYTGPLPPYSFVELHGDAQWD